MNTLWIVIPLLAGIVALAYTVVANLLRVWLNHRVKLVLLERLQEEPERLGALGDLDEFVGRESNNRPGLVDHVVLGVTLAIIGTVTALAAWCCGGRGWMTGAYFGGVVCVAVGFILTLLGLITRYLGRLPVERRRR